MGAQIAGIDFEQLLKCIEELERTVKVMDLTIKTSLLIDAVERNYVKTDPQR